MTSDEAKALHTQLESAKKAQLIAEQNLGALQSSNADYQKEITKLKDANAHLQSIIDQLQKAPIPVPSAAEEDPLLKIKWSDDFADLCQRFIVQQKQKPSLQAAWEAAQRSYRVSKSWRKRN